MTQWVDYKELRAKLDFAAVLQHYGVKLKGGGPQQQAFCPLPGHAGSGGGGRNDGRPGRDTSKRKSPSFSANLAKGIFHCFSCGAKGNVIEFAALMQNLDPTNKDDFRQAALMLAERFGIATTPPDAPADKPATGKPANRTPAATPNKPSRREAKGGGEEPKRSAAAREIVVNAPLDFTLRDLDADHPYLLRERGFTSETIQHFGLGYCSRGLMKGRIAIPLHDADGMLIGYAGRIADDEATNEECPKYLFPSSRERDGTVFEFRKSLFLYNGHAIESRVDDLIVVEGFASVWWLWQNGYRNVVALMGSACSPEQAALIVGLVTKLGRIWVFPDGDEAGTRCVASVFHDVAEYRLFRWSSWNTPANPPIAIPPNSRRSSGRCRMKPPTPTFSATAAANPPPVSIVTPATKKPSAPVASPPPTTVVYSRSQAMKGTRRRTNRKNWGRSVAGRSFCETFNMGRHHLLFHNGDLGGTLENLIGRATKAIMQLNPSELTEKNEGDLLERLKREFVVNPLKLLRDKMFHEGPREIEIELSGQAAFVYGRDFVGVRGLEMTFVVPFEGDAWLFECRPNSWVELYPEGEIVGRQFRLTLQDHQNNPDLMKKNRDRMLQQVGDFIRRQLDQITAYNNGLENIFAAAIARRKEQLKTNAAFADAFGTPGPSAGS